MKTVITEDDLSSINDATIYRMASALYHTILTAYQEDCPNLSIAEVGVIFIIEHPEDLDDYRFFGLSRPLTEDRIEYCNIAGDYADCCIVINNDFAINLIGKKEYFIQKGLIYNEENYN